MLEKHVKCPYRFVCYSDIEIDAVDVRPLENGWAGWWSKIELFKDIDDSFYIDLDMTINGDITDMVMADSDFMALRNMTPRIAGIGSAMMKWRGDKRFIYEEFKLRPEYHMDMNSQMGTPNWGDQGYLWNEMGQSIDFFQDRFPNRIQKFTDQSADVIVYYGKRRPWGLG